MLKELNGKRLLVLGGNAWADIIKSFTNDNGIVMIVAGNNQKGALFQMADESYIVDSTDEKKMKQLIKDKHIDGVYIGSNETIIRHALIYLDEVGLPCYCSLNQWSALMNKKSFKRLCEKFQIPVAHSYSYTPENVCEIDFPVVVKPADGCGSVGITICNNLNELNTAYWFAYNNSPAHEVLVEKYVKNTGMDVFFHITDGEVEWCALGDKYPVQLKKGAGSVAGARVLPSKYTIEFRMRFEEKIKKLFKYVGLKHGLIWIEVFHNGDDYFFNEVGYRANGSLSIVGIDYLCEINTVAADIYFALTGRSRSNGFGSLILKDGIIRRKNVCEYWIACKHGIVGKVEGIYEISNHPNVLAVFPKYSEGSIIPHTNGFAQNFCVIHFNYDSVKELKNMIMHIKNSINVLDVNGNDMIIHKSNSFIEYLVKDRELRGEEWKV